MNITQYLAEIEYAATQTIALVWKERQKLQELLTRIEGLTKEMEAGYSQVGFLVQNPDLDDDNLSTAIHWDTHFGADKDRFFALKDQAELKELLSARTFSTGAQSASLLQYAKQGISIAFHRLSACPPGRAVGSQSLKDVVWQARNQALHWEEGSPHSPVVSCFETLATDFGPPFRNYRAQNLAFEVVDLLGWRSFEDFERDLLTL